MHQDKQANYKKGDWQKQGKFFVSDNPSILNDFFPLSIPHISFNFPQMYIKHKR